MRLFGGFFGGERRGEDVDGQAAFFVGGRVGVGFFLFVFFFGFGAAAAGGVAFFLGFLFLGFFSVGHGFDLVFFVLWFEVLDFAGMLF